MKEELKANLLTKYVCGMCTPQEEAFVIDWLKSNASNQHFLNFIMKNLQNEKEKQLITS
jgi:hypothetical protein